MNRLMPLLFIIFSLIVGTLSEPSTYNVIDHGAIGDGQIDDTKAFLATWNAACSDTTNSTFLIPSGKTFLLDLIKFSGPCKSFVDVHVDGNILRPSMIWPQVPEWIRFENINGLTIHGSGQLDGQGNIYWSCVKEGKCHDPPRTLALSQIDNVTLSGLNFVNSAQVHINVGHCTNVVIDHLNIIAPEDSPNTDGIHIKNSHNVQIQHCNIGTGDDCISMVSGCKNINISDITCGPGHGISIGSLGEGNSGAKVEQIRVQNCSFNGSTNGVRIKTWQGGYGYVKGILFENINVTAVTLNPIVIDQFYCPRQVCSAQASAVKVSDVQYINIIGTSASDVAINLNCSQSVPCEDIFMDGVNIRPALEQKGPAPLAAAYCQNVHGNKTGVIVPDVSCLN